MSHEPDHPYFYAKPAVAGWQPIETAPKDGTWFLAYVPENEGRYVWGPFEFCSWTHAYDQNAAGEWVPFGPGYWCETDTSEAIAPTHWMPIPEPPK